LERNGKSGDALTFDGSASIGAIDTWRWDFGDGSATSSEKVVSHTYTKDGNYSATLTVKAGPYVHSASVTVNIGAGCNAIAGLQVTTMNPQPKMPVRLNSSGSKGCDGAALVQYAWDFGDGATETGDAAKASLEHTWMSSGAYDVALTVTDAMGHTGRATRTLNIGLEAGKPTVQCAGTVNATVNKKVTLSATATDPAGMAISSYAWTFGDGTATGSGATVQHTYATAGTVMATVIATTADSRSSLPCAVTVIVGAPLEYSGSWLLNPASSALTGCTNFAASFPATTLDVVHAGTVLTATPSGAGWPAGNALTGIEDAPPAAAGTFRLRKVLPNETRPNCGVVAREESVETTFTSGTTVTGTWKILFTATMCLGSGSGCVPATCNCVAQVGFTGVKQ